MPTLDWLNAQAARQAVHDVPYRRLKPVSTHGAEASGNLLIQGDNLEALKALLPLYRGRVKCIFIDPPYNTKSAFVHYDDNLEHSQWFSMMLPRLVPVGGGHFYPDFVAELNDGRLLVVESKGAHLANDPDELNKKQIGDLWAKKSNGKCGFAWVVLKDSAGRGMAAQINAAIGV